MKQTNYKYKRVVIKLGTQVLTRDNGLLDLNVLADIVAQLVDLKQNSIEVVLVSSGAVGSGLTLFDPGERKSRQTRQLLAAIGQVELINSYNQFLRKHGFIPAQVLVTKQDFKDRDHYLNIKAFFEELFDKEIIPIVNENDVVSSKHLNFTDNDELAGLIAAMINADAMFILSSIDGVYNGNPSDTKSRLIREIDPLKTDPERIIHDSKTKLGTGGMTTKFTIARRLSLLGIPTFIANGKRSNILIDLVKGVKIGTKFLTTKSASSIKRWLANSKGFEKGNVIVNQGVIDILLSNKAASILPIGVVDVDGDFQEGDLVAVMDETKQVIGYGLSNYDSKSAEEVIGLKNKKELIHYDYLYIAK